ncbi:MAG: hypothetical protein IJ645_00050 [Ruminococcus sp.]|nr:hypothetical protein [Ruminococcus sp.]
MSEAVLVALITAVASVGAQLIISRTSSARVQQAQLDSQKFLEYKIDKLAEKQEKYNNLQERVALAERDIRVANHRIDDLERKAE